MAQKSTVPAPSAAQGERLIPGADRGPSAVDRLAASAMRRRLESLEQGVIELRDGDRIETFGSTERLALSATVEVLDPSFYSSIAFGGSMGAAESFVEGAWRADDLTTLVRIFSRNPQFAAGLEAGPARLLDGVRRAGQLLRRPTRRQSRQDIMAHYDLGNEFFELFLDPTMMYSCAVFPHPEASLQEASIHKVDRICRKLELGPGMRVLEIGSGWGFFAVHAAREYGCDVVTTTISPSQRRRAERRIAESGLGDRVQVIERDYRDLDPEDLGLFDRLVSIEMIEAVGHPHLPVYFETLSRMLAADGLALVQAITIPDQKYDTYRRSVDFIQRYIFPGGLLPSIARMAECVRLSEDLRIVDIEDITQHYPPTLRTWRRQMFAAAERMDELGLDERFRRLWDFYFSYSEGGFLERVIGDVQLMLAKPLNRSEVRMREATS